jgi:hypothetical protein
MNEEEMDCLPVEKLVHQRLNRFTKHLLLIGVGIKEKVKVKASISAQQHLWTVGHAGDAFRVGIDDFGGGKGPNSKCDSMALLYIR